MCSALRGRHHHEQAAAPLDLGHPLRQAGHLLAAEDAAQVAHEGEHDGALGPEAAQRRRGAGLVEHGHLGERGGEQIVHPVIVTGPQSL